MLTTAQLLALLADHESDAVEFTTATNNTDKFCEAICAFANDFPNRRQPGYLLVGVDDDGTTSGLAVTDQLLRRLADLRSNVNLEPLPAISVRKHTLEGGDSYESNAPVQFYWYEDRIDIQSPGGLYGMASPENFPRQTDYRNPVIAEAMATLGYVNHFGRGVLRAQEALRRNGNPEAEFTFEPSHVLATIRRKP